MEQTINLPEQLIDTAYAFEQYMDILGITLTDELVLTVGFWDGLIEHLLQALHDYHTLSGEYMQSIAPEHGFSHLVFNEENTKSTIKLVNALLDDLYECRDMVIRSMTNLS